MATLQLLINSAVAPDVQLPEARPLTLTRNFTWVLACCTMILVAAPAAIAWIASLMLR